MLLGFENYKRVRFCMVDVKLVVVKSTIQDPGLATRLRQFCKYVIIVIWVSSYLINKRHDCGTLNSLHHIQTIHPIENFI